MPDATNSVPLAQPTSNAASSLSASPPQGAKEASIAVPSAVPAPSFGPGPLAAGLLLAALCVAALVFARKRRRVPRLVEIIESASLGPKRSLVVARMGDEIFLLGSSEGGIALLTTRPADPRAAESETPPASTNASGGARGIANAALDFARRLGQRPRQPPAFDALLAESAEDEELRRKLAAGRSGRVP
ncbi:MAG TPA: flagellar biosynthetic protein FliO [Anaeromyxobacteraceae bacterium]|nr:flagellar biosynthetic protein FliO [Anaeromyxobacteraceae bacterium]